VGSEVGLDPGKKNSLLPLPDIESRFLAWPDHSIINVLTELPRPTSIDISNLQDVRELSCHVLYCHRFEREKGNGIGSWVQFLIHVTASSGASSR
jgi:hypothetical protein